mmetsp:Transcript_14422/g.31594  ORF Transcript_14422/g.31594 Transcript_14422/m.31594 type:complete len:97 (-) Transcript_14422:708-998(-)
MQPPQSPRYASHHKGLEAECQPSPSGRGTNGQECVPNAAICDRRWSICGCLTCRAGMPPPRPPDAWAGMPGALTATALVVVAFGFGTDFARRHKES